MTSIDLYDYFKSKASTTDLSDRALKLKIKRLIYLNNNDYNIINFDYLLNQDIYNKINILSKTEQRIYLNLIILILNNMLKEAVDEDTEYKINKAIFFYYHKLLLIKLN
jgi:hypothetical protein